MNTNVPIANGTAKNPIPTITRANKAAPFAILNIAFNPDVITLVPVSLPKTSSIAETARMNTIVPIANGTARNPIPIIVKANKAAPLARSNRALTPLIFLLPILPKISNIALTDKVNTRAPIATC